jgi:hypothetical protein
LRQAVPPTVKVTIVRKDLQTVTTTRADVYNLVEETIIVDLEGNQLTVREMPVPCRAELIYRKEKGVRKALRIGITAIPEGATTHWTEKDPG